MPRRARYLRLAGRAQCVIDLVQRRRHGEREGDRDRREQREVVEREPCGGGDAMPREPVDAGPQRGGDDHRREQEADDEPQLPEREADDDDRTRDERCDRGSACGLHHGANRSRCVDLRPLYEHTFA